MEACVRGSYVQGGMGERQRDRSKDVPLLCGEVMVERVCGRVCLGVAWTGKAG